MDVAASIPFIIVHFVLTIKLLQGEGLVNSSFFTVKIFVSSDQFPNMRQICLPKIPEELDLLFADAGFTHLF